MTSGVTTELLSTDGVTISGDAGTVAFGVELVGALTVPLLTGVWFDSVFDASA